MSEQRSHTEPQLCTVALGGLGALGETAATSRRGSVLTSSRSGHTDISSENSDWGGLIGDPAFLSAELQPESELELQTFGNSSNPLLPLTHLKKRGRKPHRPFDPVHKKTEEKDKYWLRAFRAYMHSHFPQIRKTLTAEQRFFWRDYLSPEGKPEKGNRYSSFGRQYKNALFANESFIQQFKEWFLTYGESELMKKCQRDSPLWFVFYDYAAKELVNYDPNAPLVAQIEPNSASSGSISPTAPSPEPGEQENIFMLIDDDQSCDLDLLLEEI